MPFSVKRYQEQTKAFTAKLKHGEELTGEYRPNWLTGHTISALSTAPKFIEVDIEKEDGTSEKRTIQWVSNEDQFKTQVEQATFMVAALDVEEDDGKVRKLAKKDEIKKLLSGLTPEDLNRIQEAIRDDIAGPLEETSTDSSPGSPAKDD